ncbi:uncharacterized protein SAPINGB_P000226 [Magnusiomyces paraingens]|uniref:Uncharacterized protein n=1 Tax=Magnusiomyces paraingens TaxID=2606893 RepID=A0A5E8AYV3_9ASCO|nr:uncharacterized protein SAPINGB_P000226 [Saprochaete ingens]VVT43948.1 unnamed protein product [Saprochaete ingens]
MKLTSAIKKEVLKDLLKNINLASAFSFSSSSSITEANKKDIPQTTSDHELHRSSTPSKSKWEQKFDEITESLYGPLPMTRKEAQNLAGDLNKYLVTELEKRATKNVNVPVTDHFMDLFTALNTISTPSNTFSSGQKESFDLHSILRVDGEKKRLRLISSSTSSEELKQYLTELFYNSQLNESYATAILRNKEFKDVKLMERLLFNPSYYHTNMKVWSLNNLRLQIANKYWSLGDRSKAYSLIVTDFESVWVPALETGLLSSRNFIEGLIKALFAFKREDILQLTLDNWRKQLNDLGVEKSKQKEFIASHEGLQKVFVSIWIACVKTRQYSIAQECADCASKYFEVLMQIDEKAKIWTIVFDFLKILHSLSSQTVFTTTVTPNLNTGSSNNSTVGKIDTLIQMLGKSEGNILSSIIDVASEQMEQQNFSNTDKTRLINFVFDTVKPYIEQRVNIMASSNKSYDSSISTALALQKLKALEVKIGTKSISSSGINHEEWPIVPTTSSSP